ncbi:SufE family protein [Flexibacterium corallicola]|uniref:SufE family protein n=1 Tax=Flexibacterium corallicola TaxID=3037259 RepID=UPI00286F8493|nr:SufE family protein [Pseudovibrio sp. M1P-2-3]
MTSSIQEIIEGFEFLDDWEDRYRYVIELGKELEPLSDDERIDANKVQGCVSQVWLSRREEKRADGAVILHYKGDSDAHIVRGLVAIVLSQFSGMPAKDIPDTDIEAVFRKIGLQENLTPQRSNGLRSMVERIKNDARRVMAS